MFNQEIYKAVETTFKNYFLTLLIACYNFLK